MASSDSKSKFELVVLGSGGPRSFGRAASSYVIFVDGKPRLLVDAGPGSFLRIGQMKIEVRELKAVLLTHLHIDHSAELPGIIKSSYEIPNPVRVFGPEGSGKYPSTTRFIDLLFGAQGAFAYLPSFRFHRNGLRFVVTDLPIRADAPAQTVLSDGDLRVTSIAVDHDEAPAVAYRVEHNGHSVVITGDLASKNDNVAELASNADVLVYDTSLLDPPPGSPPKIYDLHTSPSRIGAVAAKAHARGLLLSHLSPTVQEGSDQVLKSIRSSYAGSVRFAYDCMRLDLTGSALQ